MWESFKPCKFYVYKFYTVLEINREQWKLVFASTFSYL